MAASTLEKKKNGYCNISEKTLSRLRRTPIVQYRIIGLGQINPSTGLPVLPPGELFFGSYAFYDKHEDDEYQRDKLVKYIIKSQPKEVEGRRFIEEIEGEVTFESGYITVTPATQLPLFIYLELHPANASNKLRPNHIAAKFERVEEPKTAKELLVEEDLIHQAVRIARSMTPDARRAILGAEQTEGKSSDDILLDTIKLAKTDARSFIERANDERAKTKILILDAISSNVMKHDLDTRSYYVLGDKGKKEVIFSYDPGTEDTSKALLDHLASEKGKESIAKIDVAYERLVLDDE
jgi:hypothetical protein